MNNYSAAGALFQLGAQEFRAHHALAGPREVHVALQRVDLPVVADVAEGVRAAPGGEGVRAKAAVHQPLDISCHIIVYKYHMITIVVLKNLHSNNNNNSCNSKGDGNNTNSLLFKPEWRHVRLKIVLLQVHEVAHQTRARQHALVVQHTRRQGAHLSLKHSV